MSCALWLANYGLHPVIIERAAVLGGMAERNPYPNPWLLGWPGALARQQADAFAHHIGQAGIEVWFNAVPQRIMRTASGGFALDVAGDEVPHSLSCRALVIATGTEFRGEEWLDQVENARTLAAQGRIHVGPVAVGEPGAKLGSHVAIIGGGDNAFDVAGILMRKGVKVTIVIRAAAPHAQPRLVAQVRAHGSSGGAEVLVDRSVEALMDAGATIHLRLNDGTTIEADQVVLLLGYRPNTHEPWLTELALRQSDDGHLLVDGNMETSCPGLFAVGDVANPVHPCVATALAGGTMAAREIAKRLS